MVSRAQTAEDGGPRRSIERWLLHEGTPEETIRIEMVVRRPYSLLDFTDRLVIRACRDGKVTMALERLRIE